MRRESRVLRAQRIWCSKNPRKLYAGKMRFHHNIRQHHFITGFGDAIAEFKIVGKIINQRAQAADGVERGARHGQRGAKSKVNAAFNLAGPRARRQ